MVDLLTIIAFVPTILLSSLRTDDDGFDKLNYKYTVGLLVLFAVLTASKQFDDDRIECWNRANFIKAYVQYTNEICYISSTYYVDRNQSIPQSIQERRDNKLNYYQWVPFILLLMALFFYLPRLIWRTLSVRSGIDLLDIVVAADDTKNLKSFDDRGNLIKYIVDTIDMYVDDARRQTDAEIRQTSLFRKVFQLICCMTGKFLGNYFITLYFFIKIWYILNVVVQICLLNVFLNTNFLQFGYESIKLFRYGLNQPESKYFPRETFCDFHVREPLRGGEPLQRITVQCVLTVNLFNQMSDRDDFSELIGSARNVTKCSSFYFNGRIRYGTKGEKVEERFLCMNAFRVYICSIKIPVKIESQFNILSIKLIDRTSDSHVIIETEEKQVHSLYSLHDKASIQPFLLILIRNLHAVFPHRLQAIVEIRPENEYDKLLRLSNEYYEDILNGIRPCGGFSVRYECACDLYQSSCHKYVQNLIDNVFAHRVSREFTFREFESLTQKDWLPIIHALRHNEWFTKLTIENTKLSSENIDELCTVTRLCETIKDLRLVNCGLTKDFGTRFGHCLSVTCVENLDLSNNTLEDKGNDFISSKIYTSIKNHAIQYLPIPITDIILMKTTEKDRMEKLQMLMNKLDTLCTRNQEQKENIFSPDSLLVIPPANLTREINQSWENQQQLIGDQTSLEYILSCSNRLNNKQEEIQSILTRTTRIAKISSELYESYINEEEQLKNEWNDMCKLFEQKLIEKNDRLSRKFYQLFKEQTTINYDDKLQEQIRTFFSNSNENIQHLLNKEIPTRLTTYTRECYINVATCLQKRAYDTTNDIAIDMHKQLETTIFQAAASSQQTSATDASQNTPSSTLDRLVHRGANVVHRLAHKHNHAQPETVDETTVVNRSLKKSDSSEYLTEPTLKPTKSIAKDDRLLAATQSKTITSPAPTSPKPMTIPGVGWRRSVLVNTNESESNSINADPIYNNVPNANRLRKKEMSIEDEGDLIEHDLLDLVEQEQQKELQRNNTPPPVPAKKRMAPTAPDNSLDIDIEPTTKLIHIGKDRPRRTNIKPPVKRGTNGGSHDSSSDGGLDNDDNSIGDNPPVSTNETSTTNLPNTSTTDPQTSELPPKTVTKLFKPTLKSTKATNDEPSPPPVPVKTQQHLSARPSNAQQQTNAPLTASKSVAAVTNNDISQIINSDTTHEPIHTKPLMSMSSYAGFTPSNRDEQKETYNSSENVSSPVPPVLTRSGKAAIGTRVLPALDPNGEAPPVRLRHYPLDKKVSLPVNLPPVENTIESDTTPGAGDSNTSDDNEQYKRLSVKERARLLATTNPTMLPMEKKPITPPNTTVTSPYTPRNNRRLIEQVNLFC
ncbi:unnamed protein product [Adineta steineri]|uniref:Innexin n=1 Tax=Adineta steineri TaxID=433720 RepID=A0A815G428_9BILA|nr:unnamed protein product [Adineta steineri]